jgi:hypothetical protein
MQSSDVFAPTSNYLFNSTAVLTSTKILFGLRSPDLDGDVGPMLDADDDDGMLAVLLAGAAASSSSINGTETRTFASSQQPVPPYIAEMHENGRRNALVYIAVVMAVYLTGILLLLARYWRQGQSAWGPVSNSHLRRDRQHQSTSGNRQGRAAGRSGRANKDQRRQRRAVADRENKDNKGKKQSKTKGQVSVDMW